LFIVAAISDAATDVISFRFENSIFSKFKNKNWFDPSESWKNKYKNKNPQDGPAFFGSTTCFVFLTDAWHFFQMIMLTCFDFIAIFAINFMFFHNYSILKILLIDILIFICIKTVYGFIFGLFWDNLFLKNKKK